MTINLSRAAALALVLHAASAQAQTAPVPAQPLGGPLVPGVCLLSREAVMANSALGKAANSRLVELARVAQAEIDTQRTPLETEAKAIEGQPENAQTKQRRDAFATRWQALQRQAQHNNREIDATRAKALARMATETQPVIAAVYGQKKCGLLLDRTVALGGNFGNDLTADVVRGLDAKIQTMSFERERLPQQAAQPAAK